MVYPDGEFAIGVDSGHRYQWIAPLSVTSRRRFSLDPEQQWLGELAGWFHNAVAPNEYVNAGSYDMFYQLMWEQKWPNPRSANELECGTRYFAKLGWVAMRSGFSSSDDLAALFICQRYHWSDINPYAQNSFHLMRSGWLIEGNKNTVYIDDQYQRTISDYPTIADGVEAYSSGSEFDVGPGIQAFESNDRYDYIFGDASNAYDDNQLERYLRQILYLKPDKFVILDQVVTMDSTLKKSWIIDPGAIPQAIGDTLILIDNGSSTLWMKKMIPSNINQTLSIEEIEFIPAEYASEDFFLFVLQVTPSGLPFTSPQVLADQAKLLVEENKIGVDFDGWKILFNTTGEPGMTINDGINDPPEFFDLPDITFPEDSLTTLDLNKYVFDLDHIDNELDFTVSIIDYTPVFNRNVMPEMSYNQRGRSDNRILAIEDLQITIDDISHIATFSMPDDSSGLYRVSFTVSDPEGLSDTDTINVSVTPVNDAPILSELPIVSFDEDEILGFPISQWYDYVEDVDNLDNSLYYTVQSGDNVQAYRQGIYYVFSASPDFFGEEVLQLVVSDPGQLSDSDTFRVVVHSMNDPPVLSAIPDVFFDEDSMATLPLRNYASDIDHSIEELTFNASVIKVDTYSNKKYNKINILNSEDNEFTQLLSIDDLHISIDPVSDIATFSTTSDSNGIFTVVIEVSDPEGLNDMDTMLVTVNPVSDAPQILKLPPLSFNEDDTLYLPVAHWFNYVTDIDDADSLLSFIVNPGQYVHAIQQDTRHILYSNQDFFGLDTLQLKVSDSSQMSDSARFGVDVQPINDPPVLSYLPDISFDEDSIATLDLMSYASDIDNQTEELYFDALILSFDNENYKHFHNGSNASTSEQKLIKFLDIDDLQISIDPISNIATFSTNSDSNGIFTVIFNVYDPGGLSDTDTLIVIVNPLNDAPYIMELPLLSFNEDDTLYFSISNWYDYVFDIDDPDQALDYTVYPGRYVNVMQQDGYHIFSSPENFSGSDTLKLVVTDGSYLSDSSQFRAEVIEVNDPPVIRDLPDSVSFCKDSIAVLNIWTHVEDIETEDSLLTYLFKTKYFDSDILDSLIINYDNTSGILSLSSSGFVGKSYLLIIVEDESDACSMDSVLVYVKIITNNEDIEATIPDKYALYQNYPNPFNPETIIKFDISSHSRVNLKLYNITGKEIITLVDEEKNSGSYAVSWDGTNRQNHTVSSGIYFYTLNVFSSSSAHVFRQTKKMLLLR
jgi:hypothetical protein